ncbi:MAG: hypothetical protein ACI9CF_001016 [Candidatus Omnitrophota bacterium]|jgi:hypothetical protein
MADEETTPKPEELVEAQAVEETVTEDAVEQGKLKTFLINMSLRERVIGLVAGLSVLILVVNFLILNPIRKHIASLDEKIEAQMLSIPEKMVIIQRKNQIFEDRRNNKAYLTDANIKIEEETALLLQEIERVSKTVGLFISNLNPVKDEAEAGEIQNFKVDIEGVGTIRSIKSFMIELEKSNPPVRVSVVNIRSQGTDTDEIRYKFTITKISIRG